MKQRTEERRIKIHKLLQSWERFLLRICISVTKTIRYDVLFFVDMTTYIIRRNSKLSTREGGNICFDNWMYLNQNFSVFLFMSKSSIDLLINVTSKAISASRQLHESLHFPK